MGAADGGDWINIWSIVLIIVCAGAAALAYKAPPNRRPVWIALAVAAALGAIFMFTRVA